MRKDKSLGENLKLYTVYKIEGVNLNGLTESLKRNKIEVVKAKKTTAKRLFLTIKYCDNRKFFAIVREMWYNTYTINRIRDCGRDYGLLFFIKNAGLILGAFAFILIAVLSNDYIFSVSYSGTGKIAGREVDRYLESVGVKKFSRFSDIDLERLSDEILINNDNLTFCECRKDGNFLKIRLELATGVKPRENRQGNKLYADTDGVIEEIKAYRGTETVKVGDAVKKGDLIVDDFVVIKEQTVKVKVLATAIIRAEKTFKYFSDSEKDLTKEYEVLAETELSEKEITGIKTDRKKTDGGYEYSVKVYFRHKVSFG